MGSKWVICKSFSFFLNNIFTKHSDISGKKKEWPGKALGKEVFQED